MSAGGEQSHSGYVFVRKPPETFSYDLDGNMSTDGRWNYTWDAENQLVKVESRSDTPQASWRRVEWQYDALGRRIRQTTWMWNANSGTWQVAGDLKFISDPMLFGRHIVELNGTNNSLVRTYVWGLDLSGTMDGAGGVGGLLWVTLHTATGPAAGPHFAAYDGNGNVAALVSATAGTETARYEYGPFAEPIRLTGPAANQNPFRFSTKRTCNTTDLILYEYRAYSPRLGRWMSRDPIDESGGLNLYIFVGNMPVFRLDRDGRFWAHLHAVATALAGSRAGLSGSCILLLVAGNISTDVLPGIMNDHAYHYTRPIYEDKAAALAKSKAVMEGLIRRGCELARRGACKLGLWLIGMGLHVQQDYWSHVVGGEPVSYDPEAEKGRIAYPPDDNPNHRDHARDFDWGLAFEAAKGSFIVLLWAKYWCMGCCCN